MKFLNIAVLAFTFLNFNNLHLIFLQLDGRIHSGKFAKSAGGVARNICEVLGKLQEPPHFLTCLGKDAAGSFLLQTIDPKSRKFVQKIDQDTSQCAVVLDNKGECRFLIGQMDIHDTLTPQMVINFK